VLRVRRGETGARPVAPHPPHPIRIASSSSWAAGLSLSFSKVPGRQQRRNDIAVEQWFEPATLPLVTAWC